MKVHSIPAGDQRSGGGAPGGRHRGGGGSRGSGMCRSVHVSLELKFISSLDKVNFVRVRRSFCLVLHGAGVIFPFPSASMHTGASEQASR